MKRDGLRKVVSICFGAVALAIGSAALADVGPPVEIRMNLGKIASGRLGRRIRGGV